MDKDRYKFLVKHLGGWVLESWNQFFDRYAEIPKRKALISDPAKSYIYDEFNFKKLNLEEGISLLVEFEYATCEHFIDWEYFVMAYEDTPHQSLVRDGLNKLKEQLLDANLLIRLNQYKDLFPAGIFIHEVNSKINLIEREQHQRIDSDSQKEMTEQEKKELVHSIEEKRTKIVHDLIGPEVQGTRLEIIEYLNEKKKKIASQSIERVLSGSIETLTGLDIKREHIDTLISISADYRAFKYKKIKKILTLEDESVMHNSIIDRVLTLFNLVMDDYA